MKITKQTQLIFDLLWQSCGDHADFEKLIIDNKCMTAYGDACDYLEEKGILENINDRCYKLTKKMVEHQGSKYKSENVFKQDMTKDEVIDHVGKEMWEKMTETGLLSGITCGLKNGKMCIYSHDLERAYWHAKKNTKPHPFEFD